MNPPRARIKPGRASLIGGIAVSVASFVLWAAVSHELAADTTGVLGRRVVRGDRHRDVDPDGGSLGAVRSYRPVRFGIRFGLN